MVNIDVELIMSDFRYLAATFINGVVGGCAMTMVLVIKLYSKLIWCDSCSKLHHLGCCFR